MKNYTINFTKGHLIDVSTGKRILLKRGGTFNLLGDDDQFEEKDDLSIKIEPLDSKEKSKFLKEKFNKHNLELIAKKGSKLMYRIGIIKKTKEDKDREFLFEAVLLEDLYMKSKKSFSKKKGLNWILCDCICETSKCLDGEIQIYEYVQGLSLNNLFSNMVAFYFPMQRSGNCNAFKTFFFLDSPFPKVSDVKNSRLENLDEFRNKFKKS